MEHKIRMMQEYVCPACQESKTRSHFYKDSGNKNGLRRLCKQCHIKGVLFRRRIAGQRERLGVEYERRSMAIKCRSDGIYRLMMGAWK